jgi:hypothetical protein
MPRNVTMQNTAKSTLIKCLSTPTKQFFWRTTIQKSTIVHVSRGSTPPVIFTNDSHSVVSRNTSNDNVVAKSALLTEKGKDLGMPYSLLRNRVLHVLFKFT